MEVSFFLDSSPEGVYIKRELLKRLEKTYLGNSYEIRWGNWVDSSGVKSTNIVFNTSEAIANTNDKETQILILRRNKIRCPRRIKPGKNTEFPIIGRSYTHKEGTDIVLIDSIDEYKLSDCDYFMQPIYFKKEYKVHVMELNAFLVEELYPVGEADEDELVIRTRAFGWDVKPADLSVLADNEITAIEKLAVSSIYSLGLNFGVASIGKDYAGRYFVIDVDVIPKNNDWKTLDLYIEQFEKTILNYEAVANLKEEINIGADPELLMLDKTSGALIYPSDFMKKKGSYGLDGRSLESEKRYYPIMEVRPQFSKNPIKVYESITKIFEELSEVVGYSNIGLYSGSMPLWNYWLGGHVHFSIKPNTKLIKALDNYLALPMMMIEKTNTSRQRKGMYGWLGNYRLKSHGGFEYCSLSSWLVSPKIAVGVLCLAKVIAQEYIRLQKNYLSCYSDIRAYYLVNKLYFAKKIPEIIRDIKSMVTYRLYEQYLEPLLDDINSGVEWDEENDIKDAWSIKNCKNIYEIMSTCYVPKSTRQAFSLTPEEIITVNVSNKRYNVMIMPKDDTSSEKQGFISFSKDICDEIGTDCTNTYSLWFDDSIKELRAGPVLGIFTYREPHYMGPFALQTYFFRKILKLAQNKGVLAYVFTIWDIDWKSETANGYFYDFKHSTWVQRACPLPEVIYDRGDVVSEDNYENLAIEFTQNIKKRDIQYINSLECIGITNNKWETYKLVSANDKNIKYSPDTYDCTSIDVVIQALDKYKKAFLKLKDGSRSKGIFCLESTGQDSYNVSYKNIGGYNIKSIVERAMLPTFLTDKIKEAGCEITDYIVQEGIELVKFRGRPFELRVVIQKNSKNTWLRTCCISRVIGKNGKYLDVWNEDNYKYTTVLEECFGNEMHSIKQRLDKMAMEIAVLIDKNGIKAGEISLDFGIDVNKDIYLIELNSKPDNLLARIGAYKMRNLAINRMLEYTKYIAKNKR